MTCGFQLSMRLKLNTVIKTSFKTHDPLRAIIAIMSIAAPSNGQQI
jgi:hypothetical protein